MNQQHPVKAAKNSKDHNSEKLKTISFVIK